MQISGLRIVHHVSFSAGHLGAKHRVSFHSGVARDRRCDVLPPLTVGLNATSHIPLSRLTLTTVQLWVPETSTAVDLIFLYGRAVGSCGAHSIPLGSLALSIGPLRSAELLPAVDAICLQLHTVGSSTTYPIPPGNPGLYSAPVPPPEFFPAIDGIAQRSSTVRSCDTYHIPLGDVSLFGAQVSIPESLLAVDLLPSDLQPLDRAANNEFRWVAHRLSRVHVHPPEIKIVVDPRCL